MKTKYFIKKDFFVYLFAPKELEQRLIQEGFEIHQSLELLSGGYKIEVRLPRLDTRNAINRLIELLQEVNDER